MRHAAHRDYAAGQRLAAMREDRGLSRGDLVREMQLANPRNPRMHVSERTLMRIEDHGAVPTARVKFAVSAAFGLLPSQIWGCAARAGATR
ncbi:MAG TPA: hypothetical protein VFF69_03840 [Phycisphaerales bacterium]|nr:hypothetical protein [Phycisphaerales bacterium]